eukprot:TRINITY_DN1846_c0_g1_i2.p1 TRINITY_DN1846_c0_g1~~TRINITY_DN1846_c0_g1_i2.p1  ORF type:complete len:1997 (+),score=468.29 TRINITY_DN1846_c0_g1_i2:175-6165(+)
MLNLTILSIFILSILSVISCHSIPESALRQELIDTIKEIQLYGEPKEFDASLRALLSQLEQYQITAPHTVKLEWDEAQMKETKDNKKTVCIVVSSFEGMYINSGIGTAYYALANFLVTHGHKVTVIYTRDEPTIGGSWDDWVAFYKNKEIDLLRLPPTTIPLTPMTALQAVSLRVYRYLASLPSFDIVHFADFEGHGFYPTLVKKVTNQFSTTSFVVGLHGSTRWILESNYARIPTEETEIDIDWMERMSVENADAVWTPSAYMASWVSVQGWSLPSDVHLLPLAPGPEFRDIAAMSTSVHPTEFVYFGRLEVRKGLVLFCDALDLFAKIYYTLGKEITITFLGRSGMVNGVEGTEYISSRSSKWPFPVKFMTNVNRQNALAYLMDPSSSRVAMIPSISDNAPYTVYECLYAGIPFLASSIPSISPLFADDIGRSAHLFESKPHHIVSKMAGAVRNGLSSAVPSFTAPKAEAIWTSFYDKVQPKTHNNVVVSSEVPLVSVVITHYNRPELVQQAIDSVVAQTYHEIEVVLVDDGSTVESALVYLKSIESVFKEKNWKIIRLGTNKYLGAARNEGAKEATGKYLLFLDDDNYLAPTAVETYVDAAKRAGAGVVTAGHAVFEGTSTPSPSSVIRHWFPLGSCLTAGLFKNTFGDANFFVEKSKFERVGGFTEDKGVGLEEHEFFAKSVFNGTKLEVIPEILLYYRLHSEENQMLYTTDMRAGEVRRMRPYVAALGVNSGKQEEDQNRKGHTKSLVNLVARNAATPRNTASCNFTVTAIVPNEGPYVGGNQVTIIGSGFTCTPPTSVTIGESACTAVAVVNDTALNCTAPEGDGIFDPVDVVVVFGGVSKKLEKAYRYLPTTTPDIKSAVMDENGYVTMIFTVPTDRGRNLRSLAICNSLFDAATMVLLGTADCQWTSDNSFYIALGSDSTLQVNDTLVMPAGVIRGKGPNGAPNNRIEAVVTTHQAYTYPTSFISAATQVGICQGITLDASGSIGSVGRKFTKVIWTLLATTGAPQSSVSSVSDILSAASKNRSLVVTLPATTVVSGASYHFHLYLANWFGLTDKTDTIVKKTVAVAPIVSIAGASVRSIYRDTALSLLANYSGLACGNSTAGATFKWTVTPSIGPLSTSGVNSTSLYIPSDTFTAGSKYIASFTVTDMGSGSNNSAAVKIVVVPHALVAVLLGGGRQYALNSTVTLDASTSRDPELMGGLTYSWACVNNNGSSCDPGFSNNATSQKFQAAALGAGEYTIIVTVNGALNRTAIATTIITITQLPFLKIHIEQDYTAYVVYDQIVLRGAVDASNVALPDISWSWSTTGDIVADSSSEAYPSGLSSQNLIIAPNTLQIGGHYTYQVVATHLPSGITGIAKATFTILRIAPSTNTICAQASSGLSYYSPLYFSFGDIWEYAAGVNSFQVFYAYKGSKVKYPVAAPSSHYNLTLRLPVGSLNVYGVAHSSTGLRSTFNCSATISPGSVHDISSDISVANDYYDLGRQTFSMYRSRNATTAPSDIMTGRTNIISRSSVLTTSVFSADHIQLASAIVPWITHPKLGQLDLSEVIRIGNYTSNILLFINRSTVLSQQQTLDAISSLFTASDYLLLQLNKLEQGAERARHVRSVLDSSNDSQVNPWDAIDGAGIILGVNTSIMLPVGIVPTPVLGQRFMAIGYTEMSESLYDMPVNHTLASSVSSLFGIDASYDDVNYSSSSIVVLFPDSTVFTKNGTNKCWMYVNGNWTNDGVRTDRTTKNQTMCTFPVIATFALLNSPSTGDDEATPIITSGSTTQDGGSKITVGLSQGAIAGIVLGILGAILLAALVAALAVKRHRDNVLIDRPSPRFGDSGVGGVAIDPPLDPIFVPQHMGAVFVPPAPGSSGPVFLNRSSLLHNPQASPVVYGTFLQPPMAHISPLVVADENRDNSEYSEEYSSESSDSSEYSPRSRSRSSGSISSSSTSRSSRYSNSSSSYESTGEEQDTRERSASESSYESEDDDSSSSESSDSMNSSE